MPLAVDAPSRDSNVRVYVQKCLWWNAFKRSTTCRTAAAEVAPTVSAKGAGARHHTGRMRSGGAAQTVSVKVYRGEVNRLRAPAAVIRDPAAFDGMVRGV